MQRRLLKPPFSPLVLFPAFAAYTSLLLLSAGARLLAGFPARLPLSRAVVDQWCAIEVTLVYCYRFMLIIPAAVSIIA